MTATADSLRKLAAEQMSELLGGDRHEGEKLRAKREQVLRDSIRQARRECCRLQAAGDTVMAAYERGVWHALSNAVRLLTTDWTPNGCPDCGVALPGDGSCCDACGWVQSEHGTDTWTLPSGRMP